MAYVCWLAGAPQDGSTPLHLAVVWDHVELVGLLLAAGANPSCCDKVSRTWPHRPSHVRGYVRVYDSSQVCIMKPCQLCLMASWVVVGAGRCCGKQLVVEGGTGQGAHGSWQTSYAPTRARAHLALYSRCLIPSVLQIGCTPLHTARSRLAVEQLVGAGAPLEARTFKVG